MHNNLRKRSIFSFAIAALGLSTAILIQDRENRLVAKECSRGIYAIGVIQTGIGPAYKCVSYTQAYGPTAPLPN